MAGDRAAQRPVADGVGHGAVGSVRGNERISVTLNYPKPAEAQPVFDALAQSGKVTMPLQKTFWAEAFGMVTDRFGTPWMINAGPIT